MEPNRLPYQGQVAPFLQAGEDHFQILWRKARLAGPSEVELGGFEPPTSWVRSFVLH